MLFRVLFSTLIIVVLSLAFSLRSHHEGAFATGSNTDTCTRISTKTYDADVLLKHAIRFIGKRYRYHGSQPKTGFDCSGFVMYNFKRFNIALPHSSYEQIKFGEKIEVSETKAGDLIFFKGRSVKSRLAGHVGIVVSVTGNVVKFIHSSTSLGVRYDYTNAHYYKIRFLEIRRL